MIAEVAASGFQFHAATEQMEIGRGNLMATTVDARGLACPHPVIETRKAMQEAAQVVTRVDNETAMTNVSRMAEKAGWQVEVTPEGDEFQIELIKGDATPQPELMMGKAEVVSGPLVLVVAAAAFYLASAGRMDYLVLTHAMIGLALANAGALSMRVTPKIRAFLWPTRRAGSGRVRVRSMMPSMSSSAT